MNAFHLLPGCRIERIQRVDPLSLQLEARGMRGGARCPACGVWSEAGHGGYLRRPADLPWLGRCVQIALRVRRFRCHNAARARRTFAERLPGLIAAHARRTRRLAAVQGAVAVALGGEAGARLLPRLAVPTSADTLLRLIRQRPLPTTATPTALGVDDWSFKRGRTYGTILVDLETRRAVDLLPDRRADSLAAWLRPRRRWIKVVARDRSTEFARGVELGAPRAVQVADRWHLLQNVREMLTRWLFGVYAQLRGLPAVVAACPPRRGVRTRAFPRRPLPPPAAHARWHVTRKSVAATSLKSRCAPSKKPPGFTDLRYRRAARPRCHQSRADDRLEQWPDRRPRQPARAAQTPNVRTRPVRSAASSAAACLLNPHKVRENHFIGERPAAGCPAPSGAGGEDARGRLDLALSSAALPGGRPSRPSRPARSRGRARPDPRAAGR